MQQSIEQGYAIKFCVRLGKSGASTLEMIQQAYSRESLSQAQVFRRHKMFIEGRESMEDKPRAGRPSTSRKRRKRTTCTTFAEHGPAFKCSHDRRTAMNG
ncbi:HTH_48 domain-containing protein [Trichonephila clavipes]|nr:HTH_48 domain-containing protein [Trichonephila clavipes]